MYRLESQLLSLQMYDDGRQILCVLPRGANLIAVSKGDDGFIQVSYEGSRFQVFAADLAARSVLIGAAR